MHQSVAFFELPATACNASSQEVLLLLKNELQAHSARAPEAFFLQSNCRFPEVMRSALGPTCRPRNPVCLFSQQPTGSNRKKKNCFSMPFGKTVLFSQDPVAKDPQKQPLQWVQSQAFAQRHAQQTRQSLPAPAHAFMKNVPPGIQLHGKPSSCGRVCKRKNPLLFQCLPACHHAYHHTPWHLPWSPGAPECARSFFQQRCIRAAGARHCAADGCCGSSCPRPAPLRS